MKVQVLVAAMHQEDDTLIQKMKISTDAIIGNQCDRCSNEVYQYDTFQARYYNRPDRGVGANRNVALLHAEDGVLTFADDDMEFEENYSELVQRAFREVPKADAIIFNIHTKGAETKRRINQKIKRVHIWNALNYGAARLSVKASAIRRENIYFHTCFGGGTRYGSGEDTLFIVDMLRHGLRIYTYPAVIASVNQSTSTWFTGYNKKFLYDKGALYGAVSKRWGRLLCLQALVRHKQIWKDANLSFMEAYRIMSRGVRSFKTLTSWTEDSMEA